MKKTVYGKRDDMHVSVALKVRLFVVIGGSGGNRTLHAQEKRMTWAIDSQETEGDRVVG